MKCWVRAFDEVQGTSSLKSSRSTSLRAKGRLCETNKTHRPSPAAEAPETSGCCHLSTGLQRGVKGQRVNIFGPAATGHPATACESGRRAHHSCNTSVMNMDRRPHWACGLQMAVSKRRKTRVLSMGIPCCPVQRGAFSFSSATNTWRPLVVCG